MLCMLLILDIDDTLQIDNRAGGAGGLGADAHTRQGHATHLCAELALRAGRSDKHGAHHAPQVRDHCAHTVRGELGTLFMYDAHFRENDIVCVNTVTVFFGPVCGGTCIDLQDYGVMTDVVERIKERLRVVPKLDVLSMPFRVSFVNVGTYR